MADTKISALTAATTPLAGTEVLPIVQSSTTKKVAVSDLTAGRSVSAASLSLTTTPLAVTSGGTGLATLAQGDLLYGSASNTLSALAKNTTATRYLANTGTNNNPAWAQVDLTNGVTGTLPVANGGTGTATAFTAGSVIFAGTSGVYSQDNANLFWDDTNNLLGVGTATPDGIVTIPATNSNTPRLRFQHPSNNADASIDTYQDGGGTYLTIGTNVYQSSGAALTKFDSGKAAGLAYFDTSGLILFYNATAAGGFVEQLRIGTGANGDVNVKTGNLVIGTSGKGIDFSANTHAAGMTSELLNWYEEGTFTPTITAETPGNLAVTYQDQYGKYTRIGRQVTVNLFVNTSAFTHTTASGNFRIAGLPFTSGNITQNVGVGSMIFNGITKAGYTNFVCAVGPNTNYIQMSGGASATAASLVVIGDVPTGGTPYFYLTVSYMA